MAIKITAYKGKVKQKGLFGFKDLYEFLYDYFLDEGYDPYELSYSEKRAGNSKDVEIAWEATKNISDYFQIKITAFWIILGMKSVEVEKEGKKVEMDSGTLEIGISGLLIKDYQDKWEKSPWKSLRKIYDNFIIKKRIEQYKELVREETEEFIAYIKSILSIEAAREKRKETIYI